MTLYAEDLKVGTEIDLGTYLLSREELIAFAKKWDPQPFHIDPGVAATGQFGDVIASGMHTLAVFQRLSILTAENQWAVIAGVQIRNLRFLAPVRPDTELRGWLRIEAVALEPERSRGLVTKRGVVFDGDTRVLEMTSDAYVWMRPRRT